MATPVSSVSEPGEQGISPDGSAVAVVALQRSEGGDEAGWVEDADLHPRLGKAPPQLAAGADTTEPVVEQANLDPGPRPFAEGIGDLRTALYDITTQMMQDMNVEFEFQVRQSLRDWLQVATTAPPPPPVEQQPLGAPVRPAP